MNVLYTLLIFPIEQILELSFVFALRVINDPALSILGISLVVSILTLPLYLMGEKHQRSERDIQNQMKLKVDKIKAVFSGDERFMLLSTYYRQNGYHPIYSLRSSIPLIIQIPFFIAAYHFLSNMEMISGISFGPIANLGKPDSLLTIKNVSINVLPIIMTLISLISAALYVKGSSAKEKIQLYGMSALFLVLLYNSPSGLALYWTGNNIFSLVKNIIYKMKKPKQVTFILVSVLCLFLDIYLLFIHKGWIVKRVFLVFLITVICLFPIFTRSVNKLMRKLFTIDKNKIFNSETSLKIKNDISIFVLSLLILFLLMGFVIPSSLIASSVQEFTFIFGKIVNPFIFIGNTILQSAGMFVLWPLIIYLLFSKEVKSKVTKLAVVICVVAIINALFFPGSYGFLTIDFIFSENINAGKTVYFMNLFVLASVVILALFLIRNFRNAVLSSLIITLCVVFVFGSVKSIKIYKEYLSFKSRYENKETVSSYEPVFQFSKTGKNVLVIMLDRAISGYIPYIFDERHDLYDSFDGFTWYKNSISFGPGTQFGSPTIFGGYEYTPLEMNARSSISLAEKQNEALLMLPRIFLDEGYNVTVTDPPFANYSWFSDLSIFNNYPEIHAENILGKYNRKWLLEKAYFANPDIILNNKIATIKADIIRFSFFKIAPLLFRNFIYDHGKWLILSDVYYDDISDFNQTTLSNYIALDILDKITEIKNVKFNTYTAITNDLTHSPVFMQFPDYIPANSITDRGNGPFSNEEHYHVNVAALMLLGKWFDFLKRNDVYDNTRIIIVSDHGKNIYSKFQDNILLPNNQCLETYTALFLVKDFNSRGLLSVDNLFMTNADVPLIALKDIIEKPVNPWTGKEIKSDKEYGITLTTNTAPFEDTIHLVNMFDIKPDEWLHVHTNIYNSKNWSRPHY
jgi:YidC/Oxa1 family membrane protein insertase